MFEYLDGAGIEMYEVQLPPEVCVCVVSVAGREGPVSLEHGNEDDDGD